MLVFLLVLLGSLLVLALAGAGLRGPRAVEAVLGGCALAGLGCAVLGLLALRAEPGSAEWALLAAGPGRPGVTLGLDALSGWFLLILGLLAAATCAAAWPGRTAASPRAAPLPLWLGGTMLALVAADGMTLLLGVQAAALAAWGLRAPGRSAAPGRADAGRDGLAAPLLGGAGLLAALALLGAGLPPETAAGRLAAAAFAAPSFGSLRAVPPEGWRAAAVLALALAGAAALAGLLLLPRPGPGADLSPPGPGAAPTPPGTLADPALPGPVAALLAGGAALLGLYAVARLLLDLAGPAQPGWWGLALAAAGAALALLSAGRAQRAATLDGAVDAAAAAQAGLVVLGLGLAAVFRAADLGPLAALAAGAALLHALHAALFLGLLALCAAAVAEAAGSRALDRLGGLCAAMPLTAAGTAAGAAAAGFLPPFSGFASGWLLLQALLAAWRAGDVALQLAVAGLLAAAALAASLLAAAMLRLFGLAFLGRPRHPRTMAATDPAGPARAVPLALAALCLGLGLLPGPLLMLAEPALLRLTGTGAAEFAGPLLVRAGGEGGVLLPWAAALLLAAATGGLFWATRLRGAPPATVGPAWEGGFIAPPPHLPFGDPATQPTAAGLVVDWPPERARGTPGLAAPAGAFGTGGAAAMAAAPEGHWPDATPGPDAAAEGRRGAATAAAADGRDPDGLRGPARALQLALGARLGGGADGASARRGVALLLAALLGALALTAWLGPRP